MKTNTLKSLYDESLGGKPKKSAEKLPAPQEKAYLWPLILFILVVCATSLACFCLSVHDSSGKYYLYLILGLFAVTCGAFVFLRRS